MKMGIRNVSKSKKLGDVLVDVGLLTPQQLKEAAEVQRLKGGKLGDVLVDLKFLSREVLLSFLGKRCGVSYVALSEFGRPSPEALSLIPVSVARRETLLPLKRDGQELTVAMADPLNVFVIDDLRIMTGCEVKVVVASEGELRAAIESSYGETCAMPSVDGQVRFEEAPGAPPAETGDLRALNLLNVLLDNAARAGALAVHLEPAENAIRVRYRLGEVLVPRPDISGQFQEGLTARLKGLARMNPLEMWAPQEGHIRAKVSGRELDIRVSTLPTFYGEKIVLRFIDTATPELKLERLGLDVSALDAVLGVLRAPEGLILVTGPAGAGKTATFYAALLHLSRPDRHLATLEDPVERCLEGLTQVQARPHVGLTQASGVRSLLRQDPDVIGLGEIRGPEEATAALDAVAAGVPVIATLRADGPMAAVRRLLEAGAAPEVLASRLQAVIFQRWARRLCPSCKEAYTLSRRDVAAMGFPEKTIQNLPGTSTFFRPKGCNACGGTGESGRALLVALTVPDERMRDDIRRGVSAPPPAGTAVREAGFRKALEGEISLEEALR
jgi:type IV pilus assembly protein PilB